MPTITAFAVDLPALRGHIEATLGAFARRVDFRLGEITVQVASADYLKAATLLRDAPGCRLGDVAPNCAPSAARSLCPLKNKPVSCSITFLRLMPATDATVVHKLQTRLT